MGIGFDSASKLDFGASPTWVHVCGANATALFVFIRDDGDFHGNGYVTGVLCNDISMLLLGTSHINSSIDTYSYRTYYLLNPPVGGCNLFIQLSTPENIAAVSASYTGTSRDYLPTLFSFSGVDIGFITADSLGNWGVYLFADLSRINPQSIDSTVTSPPGTFPTDRAMAGAGASITIADSNGFNLPIGTLMSVGAHFVGADLGHANEILIATVLIDPPTYSLAGYDEVSGYVGRQQKKSASYVM